MFQPPQIDYTDKDYGSLRRAMLDLARYRLPEWTDRSAGDLGMLLVDLFAYMGDIVLYYQDRIANESFLHTATERRSVLHLLRLIGYALKPPVAAYADLSLTFNAPGPGESTIVTVPGGAQFASKGGAVTPEIYEYLGPTLEIDLDSSQVSRLPGGRRLYENLPVRHSRQVVDEILGSSNGEPGQRFPLARSPAIPESLSVQVNEAGTWLEWQQRENFLYRTDPGGLASVTDAEARDYTLETDENDVTSVVFGDGVYSRIPPLGANNVRASYRIGGGTAGNLPAGAITEAKTALRLLDSVTNPGPAAGGADHEDLGHAVRFGPLAFRSGQRAVTLDDFVALTHQFGGIAKVRANPRSWSQVDLYVAPEGDSARSAPESLKRQLLGFFEHKRMVGTFVAIRDPSLVPIDIGVEIVVEHSHKPDIVRQAVETAVRSLLDFRNVDFGQPLYLSKVYEAVERLDGVHAATVTRFTRQDSDVAGFQADLDALAALGITNIPQSVRQAVSMGLNAEGRIRVDEFEIPVPGRLEFTVQGAMP